MFEIIRILKRVTNSICSTMSVLCFVNLSLSLIAISIFIVFTFSVIFPTQSCILIWYKM
jgi:hypothetical protein